MPVYSTGGPSQDTAAPTSENSVVPESFQISSQYANGAVSLWRYVIARTKTTIKEIM